MLDVDNIDLHYGAAQALRGISLKAEPGKVTCVLGRNGVGKTSLLRAIVGQHPVSAGAITFDGNDITKLSHRRARPPRHRHRAAGPRDLPAADGARKIWRPALRRCRATSATCPTTCSRCFRC